MRPSPGVSILSLNSLEADGRGRARRSCFRSGALRIAPASAAPRGCRPRACRARPGRSRPGVRRRNAIFPSRVRRARLYSARAPAAAQRLSLSGFSGWTIDRRIQPEDQVREPRWAERTAQPGSLCQREKHPICRSLMRNVPFFIVPDMHSGDTPSTGCNMRRIISSHNMFISVVVRGWRGCYAPAGTACRSTH